MMFQHYVSVVSVRVIGESNFMDEFLKSSDNHITVRSNDKQVSIKNNHFLGRDHDNNYCE